MIIRVARMPTDESPPPTPDTDPSLHRRVGELFAALLERPADERPAAAREAAGGDEALLAELLSLLEFAGDGEEQEPATPPRLSAGDTVAGRFRLVAPIGVGGMGEVWKAVDTLLGETVALKSVRRSTSADPLGEIRLARRATHPNLCRVHDAVVLEGRILLSMEWVDGEDLASVLARRGPLPVGEAIDLVAQAAAGLAAAHAAGVLHRDLKPANILLGKDGRVRLTDFGLAEVAGEGGDGPLFGSPAYMAPELLAGQGGSERSELFSLAMVLYEMIAGHLPVEGGALSERVDRLRRRDWPPLSSRAADVPPDLDRALERALAPDPADRFESVLAFAGALPGCDPLRIAAVAGVAPSVALVAAAKRGDRLGGRTALLLGAAIAVALGLLVALRSFSAAPRASSLPPAELVATAERLLPLLGHRIAPADREWGFTWDDDDRVDGDLLFWYRRWDRPAVANEIGGHGHVYERTPPLKHPGDLLLVLSPEGEPVELEAVPRGSGGESPLSLADDVRSLVGPGVEVEVAGGAVVRVGSRRPPEPPDAVEVSVYRIVSWLYAWILPMVSIPLALLHLRAGRGNGRGALRAGFVLGLVRFAGGMACAHHPGDLAGEFQVLRISLADGLIDGMLVALALLAVEPLARRFWPESVVAATRVVEGRGRDPLVGTSLAAGTLAGLAWALLSLLGREWGPAAEPVPDWFALDLSASPLLLAANLFERVPGAVGRGLLALLIVVALRFLLRRTDLAALAAVAILAWPATLSGPLLSVPALLAVAGWGAAMLVLLRFGLVAMVVAILTRSIHLDFPPLVDLSTWWAPSAFVAPLLSLVLAGLGLRWATEAAEG